MRRFFPFRVCLWLVVSALILAGPCNMIVSCLCLLKLLFGVP